MKHIVFIFLFLFTNFGYSDFSAESLQEAVTSVRRIKNDIKNAGRVFGVEPEIIAGAILAEHALNVDWKDRWQNRAVRNEWSRRLITQSTNQRLVNFLTSDNVVNNCSDKGRAYRYWYCVIKSRYALSFLIPTNSNYKRFTNEYFNPNGIGTTFGLGQLSPLRALMVTDVVSSRTNIPMIDFTSSRSRDQLYNDLLNPSRVVYYIAGTMRQAAEIYRAYGFEVSGDMGVLVTLYNIGNEEFHASKRRREGGRPRANSMGEWAEDNIELIRNSIR